jgi:hypothetical protein
MSPKNLHTRFAPRPPASGRFTTHSMKRILLPALSFVVLTFAATAAVLPPEQLLPDDTLAVVTVPDFAKVQATYKSSPQLQLWSDPALKPFRDKLTGKIDSEFVSPLERELNVHFSDYTSLPQGQITLAVVQDGWTGDSADSKDPAFLFLLDARDKSSQLKSNLADLKKKWVDSGRTAKTETIRDVEFSVITLSSNDIPSTLKKASGSHGDSSGGDSGSDAGAKPADAPKAASSPAIYIGQAESMLIIGDSKKVIEKVLAAMAGGDVRTLGQLPAYAANNDALFHDAPFFGWVNAHALVEIGKRAAESAAANSQSDTQPAKIFAALGLDGLKTLAFSYHFASDGAQFNFLIGVPEDGRTGIFKMLAGEPKECTPPAFVPADTIKFQRWRIDGKKLWDDLRQIVGNISPQGLGGVDFMLGSAEAKAKEKDPDFDLQKNLFGNLGDDFITYQKAARGSSLAALASPPTLYLLGSPHPEQLANALNALLVLISQQATPTSRDFLGRKIYSLPLPSPGMAEGQTNSLNYVSSGGYLAITTDTAMLEEYLRSGDSPAKPLRETPGLDAAIEKVSGPGTSMFGYSNDSETMRQLFSALKNDSSNGLGTLAPLAMAMGMGNANFKDWIDFSLLPDFNQISKYFSFSVYAGAATPDGLMMKAFTPTPAQFNK